MAVAEAYSICTAVDARYRREVGAARERERALEEKVKKREALVGAGGGCERRSTRARRSWTGCRPRWRRRVAAARRCGRRTRRWARRTHS